MPRLNARGQATTGYQQCWFDDDRTILQDCSTGVCKVVLSDGTIIAEAAANYVYANGAGTWVAFRSPSSDGSVPPLVFASGWDRLDAGLDRAIDPVGPDGSIAYKDRYFSFGPWKVRNADGSFGETFGGDCHFVQNLGGGRLLWTEVNDRLKATFDFPYVDMRVWWPRFVDGHFLFQSAETTELVLDGYVIGPGGNYFRPDVRDINGQIKVVWSVDEGEGDTQWRLLTAAELATLPVWKPTPAPPPVDPPKPPDPLPPTPMRLPDNVFFTLKAERDTYGDVLPEDVRGALLNRVAWIHRAEGWGVNRKDGGHKCESPAGNVACDILHHQPSDLLFDVIAGDERGTVQQGDGFPPPSSDRFFVAPADPGDGPPSPPRDTDARQDADIAQLTQRQGVLESKLDRIADLIGTLDTNQQHALQELADRVRVLEAKPSAELPPDVVRESTHVVKLSRTLSFLGTAALVKK